MKEEQRIEKLGSGRGKHACAMIFLGVALVLKWVLLGHDNKNLCCVENITPREELISGNSRPYLNTVSGESSPRKEMK